jgi:hypothetical protein
VNIEIARGIPERFLKTCRGPNCDARIAMAITEQRNWQPVEPTPDPTGNLIVEIGDDGRLHSRVAGMFDPEGPRWWPHHARCPDVDLFRR